VNFQSTEFAFDFNRILTLKFATLLTDFGLSDYYVGAMKGALLSVCPRAIVIDLTHETPPFDVETGAFLLLASYAVFPPATVHVAVVDPGVGSERRAILAATRSYFFVAPDNGLLSYIFEREAAQLRVYHVTNENYFRREVSATFHGRDIFAPVAGALLNGAAPEEIGAPIDDYIKLPALAPTRIDERTFLARILHIDRFGNCVTNITRRELCVDEMAGARLHIGAREIRRFQTHFAAAQGDEVFAYWGSAGFLEIGIFGASAAERLGVERNREVRLICHR
jgi:S-adenosylmethionine hydrolase